MTRPRQNHIAICSRILHRSLIQYLFTFNAWFQYLFHSYPMFSSELLKLPSFSASSVTMLPIFPAWDSLHFVFAFVLTHSKSLVPRKGKPVKMAHGVKSQLTLVTLHICRLRSLKNDSCRLTIDMENKNKN